MRQKKQERIKHVTKHLCHRDYQNISKKGYFYTLSVLFFIGLLLALFYVQSGLLSTLHAQQSRANTMDDFLYDLERDLDRAAYISGFRAMIALEEYVADNGEYLTNISASFSEAFLSGTIENSSYEVLANSTFTNYSSRISQEARSLGMVLSIDVTNVSLYHISAWEIGIDYTLNISLNDTKAETRWRYSRVLSTIIPIYDLRDPLYAVETNNKVPNTIRTYSGFTEFIDDAGDLNDTTILTDYLTEGYYVANPLAPSFLQRFTGNLSASPYGIESLVNLDDLDAQGVTINEAYSVVDYVYFSDIDAVWCSIQNMPSYFKLDDDHLAFYEVEDELDYSVCP